MTNSAMSLCGKASYVWYTKVEEETLVDTKSGEAVSELKYMTYIDAHQYLLTKCRKPKDVACPTKVQNLTYGKFKKNILDSIK
jgi:hypothetical protein